MVGNIIVKINKCKKTNELKTLCKTIKSLQCEFQYFFTYFHLIKSIKKIDNNLMLRVVLEILNLSENVKKKKIERKKEKRHQ